MAGVWKKTLNYLGLVEEDEDFVEDMPEADPAPVRRMRPQAVREVSSDTEGVVRTISSNARPPVAATGAIYKSEPKRFNEAREVADHFKEGTAVIMNLAAVNATRPSAAPGPVPASVNGSRDAAAAAITPPMRWARSRRVAINQTAPLSA